MSIAYFCRFVLENSGVAEPQNIRDQFNEGVAAGKSQALHALTRAMYITPKAWLRPQISQYSVCYIEPSQHSRAGGALSAFMPGCMMCPVSHSGLADCVGMGYSLRARYALPAGNPLMQRIRLDTLVTIVDAGTFIQDYASRVPLAARPDLGEGGNLRPVVDLLVEQIECVPVLPSKFQHTVDGLFLAIDIQSLDHSTQR